MARRPRRTHRMIAVLAVLGFALAACGADGDDPRAADPPTETKTGTGANDGDDGEDVDGQALDSPVELVPIEYATSFGAFGRDAYAYVALEKGYFEEAGFDVTISPGQGSVNNARFLASGQFDYAPVDFSALVLLRANEDLPVRLVSFVHQQGLAAIMTKADSGIETPQDLPGHSLADIPGSVIIELFEIYAERVGFDPDTVEFLPADPPQLPGLLASGQVDAVNQFVVGKPLFEQVTGGEITVFPYAEVFPEFPGIGIAVSEERLEEQPEQVRRFVEALNRGLVDALADPEGAGEILAQHQPEADPQVAAAELEIMAEFVTNDFTEANGLGSVDAARIEESVRIITATFGLQATLSVEDLYAAGFTD